MRDPGDELPEHLRPRPVIDWQAWVGWTEEPGPDELLEWMPEQRALEHWRECRARERQREAAQAWCAERGRDVRRELSRWARWWQAPA